jgi:NDP-sugar pyrophosphorylase family protein
MKAIVLCAGHGTRMRPLTYYVNKAMIPVAGTPLLEHIVTKLRDQGFTDLIVALSLLGEQVSHYFGEGERFGVKMCYSFSEEPLGTAGEVDAMRELLEGEEDFLVHYGDILTSLDAAALAEQHLEKDAAATLGLVTGVNIHTGVAELNEAGEVTHFVEKPPLERPCNAAVLALNRRALDYVGRGKDFSNHVIPEMIAAGEPVFGFLDENAYWYDVGRLSDLEAVNEAFSRAEP